MYLKPGGNFAFQCLWNSASNGALTNVDVSPAATAVLTRNGVDDGAVAVTITNISAGRYKLTGALPGGYASGDVCQVVMLASVGGIAGAAVAGEFVVDTASHADIVTAVAGLPALVWDSLTSAARVAGSYGAKLKAWALGTDNKALISADAGNLASLSANDESALSRLFAMTTSGNAFTAPALVNAPTGAGGGGGATAAQVAAAILANPANLLQTDAAGKVLLQPAQATALTPPAPAAVLAAFKADGDWQTMLANVNGVFDYNEATKVLTLRDKTGTTTLATLTMTLGTAAVTHRASA